jgi:hypothetical protein
MRPHDVGRLGMDVLRIQEGDELAGGFEELASDVGSVAVAHRGEVSDHDRAANLRFVGPVDCDSPWSESAV